MTLFVLRRIASGAVLLVTVSLIVYLLLYPATPDLARNILGENASEDQVELLNQQLGLDQPLINQYLGWLGHAVTGDLGRSYFTSQPVWEALSVRLPVTLSLVVLVTVLSGTIAFALGTLAAVRRGWVDRVLQVLVTLGDALPAFILALFFVTVFALNLHWFPATGYVSPTDSVGQWLWYLTLPVVAMTILGVAGVSQQVRSATINVLRMDYVRTLRSRGLSEPRIILTNVLRNASTNGLTSLAVQVVGILGASVVIERVFALPGLGSLAIESTTRADVPLIIGIVMAYVVIVVIVNLLVDVLVAWLNPKVRLS